MALDKYEGVGELQVNNKTLAEASSVSISGASNSTPVTTMRKGLAGRSRGAVQFEISVSNAVPKAGLEDEWIQYMVEDQDMSVSVIFGGRIYVFDGWIDNVDTSQSTDSAAEINFTIIAGKPRIF